MHKLVPVLPYDYTDNMRRLCFLAVFLNVFTLHSQSGGSGPANGIFPLTLVLEGAEYAREEIWRPDWPSELPPDAFKLRAGEISRIYIEQADVENAEGEGFSLNLSFGPGGLVEEFPFVLNGNMAQVSLVYNDAMEIQELTVIFSSGKAEGGEAASGDGASDEAAWKMEFLEYSGSFPFLVRASSQDAWYFIYFSGGVNEILESWYDEEGKLLGAYSFSLAETGNSRRIRAVKDFSGSDGDMEYYYDSRGLLSETLGPGGRYKVLFYREDFPRYWERTPSGGQAGAENFSIQWDERDLIVRFRGEPENAEFVDYRYEYILDEKGNWIERREIRMIRNLELLAPSPGTTFRRVLEYKE